MWNKEKGKIYFDMDGVLADFDRGLWEMCGMEPQPQGDEATDAATFAAVRGADHFYLNLQPCEGMLELFAEVRSKYGDRVEILTGVPSARRNIPEASEDKREWVRKYIGDDVVVHTVARKEKQEYAEGSVLIDDLEKNIREWEAAGGIGLLHTDVEDTRKVLIRLNS